MNVVDMLVCPECRKPLSQALSCGGCGTQYACKHSVYDVVPRNGLEDTPSFWKITDKMLGNPDAYLQRETQEETWKADYESRKNEETKAAERRLNAYTDALLGTISGTVCDLATGTGRMLRKLLASGSDVQIVCTDIDPGILAWTRLVLRTDDSRVAYVAADGRKMSFRDESFDYVTSFAAFGNIPDSDRVARELHRILKKGGKLIVQGQYIELGSKSYRKAKRKHLEQGLVEELLIECLQNAGFRNVDSVVVDSAVWARNPYDLLPVAGDTQKFCCIQAEK